MSRTCEAAATPRPDLDSRPSDPGAESAATVRLGGGAREGQTAACGRARAVEGQGSSAVGRWGLASLARGLAGAGSEPQNAEGAQVRVSEAGPWRPCRTLPLSREESPSVPGQAKDMWVTWVPSD